MRTAPSGWYEARKGLYRWETKVDIAGVEYREDNIFSLSTTSALFAKNTISIGGCVSKEINLTVMPQGTIPRMAEIRVWIRPVAEGDAVYADVLTEHKINSPYDMYSIPALGLVAGETYVVTLDGVEYTCEAVEAPISAAHTYVLLQSPAFQLLECPPDLAATLGYNVEFRFVQYPDHDGPYPISIKRKVEAAWLQKGVFYIDTRETDRVTGIMAIHGYDAMLKAEQTFLTEQTEDDWPKPMNEVVAEIAERMGVTVDARTTVSSTFKAEYPLDYTMREVLGYIAVAHAGNWIMTDVGELRLIGLADTPEETHYLVAENGDLLLFGNTRITIV